MSVDFTYKSVDIWLLLSSKTVTSRKESWVYNDVCASDELLEGFSLMFRERLSAIFDGLVLRMSLLSNCIKSSNPRSRSLFGVHEFFFLKGFGSET